MKVIVAGIPRCGTTYMWRSLSGHDGVDVAHSYGGSVIKTHSLAPWHMIGYRAIFMYGDIVNAVASTMLNAITVPHLLNCGCFRNIDSVVGADRLHYEQMFDSWNRYNGYPVLMLRYETCYKYSELISDFLWEKVQLLPFHQRTTDPAILQPDIVEKIKSVYASLIAKEAAMPEYKLIYRKCSDPWVRLHDTIKQYEISEG